MKIPKTIKLPRKLKKELKKNMVYVDQLHSQTVKNNEHSDITTDDLINFHKSVFCKNLIEKQKNINKIADNFDNTTSIWFL